jgi:hypothetical protein
LELADFVDGGRVSGGIAVEHHEQQVRSRWMEQRREVRRRRRPDADEPAALEQRAECVARAPIPVHHDDLTAGRRVPNDG